MDRPPLVPAAAASVLVLENTTCENGKIVEDHERHRPGGDEKKLAGGEATAGGETTGLPKLGYAHGSFPDDKAVVCTDAARARRRAEQGAIRLHADCKIKSIGDLWPLELEIRLWRKDRQHRFTLNYEQADPFPPFSA